MTEYTIFNITTIDDDIIDPRDEWDEVCNYFLSNLDNLDDNIYQFKPNYKYDNDSKYNQRYNCIYLQTYGGGPEGGIMILPNGKIYEVERNWGSTFNFRHRGDTTNLEIGTTGELLYIKLIS
jgi:hypothetical protein